MHNNNSLPSTITETFDDIRLRTMITMETIASTLRYRIRSFFHTFLAFTEVEYITLEFILVTNQFFLVELTKII